MIFRVTLTHLTESFVISEPDGLKELVLGQGRDELFWTLAKFVKTPFSLYGSNGIEDGYREWYKGLEETYGPELIIHALIEINEDDLGFEWEELFYGKLSTGATLEQVGTDVGHTLDTGLELESFWTDFISRLEIPVDVQSTTDLDGNAVSVLSPITTPLTSQIINMAFTSELDKTRVLTNPTWQGSGVLPTRTITTQFDDQWLQLAYDRIIEELQTVFDIPIDFNPELPVGLFVPEYAGEYHITSRQLVTIINGGEFFGPGRSYLVDITDFSDRSVINFFYQKNSETPVQFGTYTSGIDLVGGIGEASAFDLDVTIDLVVGDQVRIYGKFADEVTVNSFSTNDGIGLVLIGKDLLMDLSQMGGAIEGDVATLGIPDTDIKFSYINIEGGTTFPETEADGFLTHDLISEIVKRTCGAPFYSEYLGSPNTLARQYDYTGCGANYMHFKGLQLRAYPLSEKPFFQSAKDWWEGMNPILNIALGYDRIDGENVIRVWKKEEVFDPEMCILLSNVRQITRSYDREMFFNLVEIGFQKWESEDISGIDDTQSKRQYATILKNLGVKISLLSKMIGASLAFETTRRFVKKKSADYKFDNETFVLAVWFDEYGFRPELSEEFTDVTGLLNEETRYNKRITSARNLLRWITYLSGCLKWYPGTEFKFTSGEGNFDMQATQMDVCDGNFDNDPFSEKQNIPASELILFLPMLYKIDHTLTFEQWKVLDANPTKAVGVSQRDTNHKPFFRKNLEYTPWESTLMLLAWPKEWFNIEVIDDDTNEREMTRTGGTFDCTFDLSFDRALCA